MRSDNEVLNTNTGSCELTSGQYGVGSASTVFEYYIDSLFSVCFICGFSGLTLFMLLFLRSTLEVDWGCKTDRSIKSNQFVI